MYNIFTVRKLNFFNKTNTFATKYILKVESVHHLAFFFFLNVLFTSIDRPSLFVPLQYPPSFPANLSLCPHA